MLAAARLVDVARLARASDGLAISDDDEEADRDAGERHLAPVDLHDRRVDLADEATIRHLHGAGADQPAVPVDDDAGHGVAIAAGRGDRVHVGRLADLDRIDEHTVSANLPALERDRREERPPAEVDVAAVDAAAQSEVADDDLALGNGREGLLGLVDEPVVVRKRQVDRDERVDMLTGRDLVVEVAVLIRRELGDGRAVSLDNPGANRPDEVDIPAELDRLAIGLAMETARDRELIGRLEDDVLCACLLYTSPSPRDPE